MLTQLDEIKSLRVVAEAYLRESSLLECGAGTPREEQLRRIGELEQALRRELAKGQGGPAGGRFRRILIATDGSPEAQRAESLAAQLAADRGAHLMLACVADTRWAHGPDEIAYTELQLRAALCQKADQYLAEAVSRVPGGVAVERRRREGEPAGEILNVAKAWGADLIVMGTRGRGRLRGLLLGSTAQEVLHGAQCPVLVVPHAAVEASPLDAEPAEVTQPSMSRLGRRDVLQEETES